MVNHKQDRLTAERAGESVVDDTLTDVAQAVAELGLDILTPDVTDDATSRNNYKEFRKAYKQHGGKGRTFIFLPTSTFGRPYNKKEEWGDELGYSGYNFWTHDLIVLRDAPVRITLVGDFLGSQPADVEAAIDADDRPLIIYERDGDGRLKATLEKREPELLASPTVHQVSTPDKLKETIRTIINSWPSRDHSSEADLKGAPA